MEGPLGEGPIRVFLVAGHSALNKSLEMLLADEGMLVGSWVPHGTKVLMDLSSGADVVVVGLSGSGEIGLDLVREMAAHVNAPPCIVLSANDDLLSIRKAFAAGARGYVTNRDAPEVLAGAIREVAAGRGYEPRLRAGAE